MKLKIDPEDQGIVTGIVFRPSGHLYLVAWPDRDEHDHYECELLPDES